MANSRSQEKKSALSQLGALRNRLAAADPNFKAAAEVEREAETFCDKVRTELKAHRLALGLDQHELANRMEFSQSAISKIESGRGDLTLKTVFRVAAAMGLKLEMSLGPGAKAQEGEQSLVVTKSEVATALAEAVKHNITTIVEAALARIVARPGGAERDSEASEGFLGKGRRQKTAGWYGDTESHTADSRRGS